MIGSEHRLPFGIQHALGVAIQKDDPIGAGGTAAGWRRFPRQDEIGVPPIGQRVIEIHVLVPREKKGGPLVGHLAVQIELVLVFLRGIPQRVQNVFQIVQTRPVIRRYLELGLGRGRKGPPPEGRKLVLFLASHHVRQFLTAPRGHGDLRNVNAEVVEIAKDHFRVRVDLASVMRSPNRVVESPAIRRFNIIVVVAVVSGWIHPMVRVFLVDLPGSRTVRVARISGGLER